MFRLPGQFLCFLCAILAAPAIFAPLVAKARVVDVDIRARFPFAGGREFGAAGPYEVIVGRLVYAVDPAHQANSQIVDLALAPVDGNGDVSFRGDFVLLKPRFPGKANRRLLFEVTNRGNLAMLGYLNFAAYSNRPAAGADGGDGFLMRHGYTLLWTAWNWDVTAGGGRLQIELPIAMRQGRPLSGQVVAEMVPTYRAASLPFAWGNSRGYPALLEEKPAARLTVRRRQAGQRRLIAPADWSFANAVDGQLQPSRHHLSLHQGFEPGRIYELRYRASEARVVGLGLASLRDAGSFFRFDTSRRNPLASTIDHVIGFGISQSGRVLQHMLWQGFNSDEAGRQVFEAMFVHVPGAGKGSFNHRFAQTTRHQSQHEDHQYPADIFPFATVAQSDPLSGRHEDLLARARAAGALPKLFYTQTSTDYWSRSASLLHTDVSGSRDLPLDPSARLYVFAGGQHGVWVLPRRGRFALCHNPADYRPVLRALLLRLDGWMSGRTMPPASVYPNLAGGSLGTLAEYRRRFPKLPEAAGSRLPPGQYLRPPRLDLGPRFRDAGIIDRQPPKFGPPFEARLPLPDADGIDLGGIRLPRIAVPLGSHVGWNPRRDGAADAIGRWAGGYIPFAADPVAAAAGDSRRPLSARYRDRQDYVAKVGAAADRLVQRGFLLPGDVAAIAGAAALYYSAQLNRSEDPEDCAYLRR